MSIIGGPICRNRSGPTSRIPSSSPWQRCDDSATDRLSSSMAVATEMNGENSPRNSNSKSFTESHPSLAPRYTLSLSAITSALAFSQSQRLPKSSTSHRRFSIAIAMFSGSKIQNPSHATQSDSAAIRPTRASGITPQAGEHSLTSGNRRSFA